LITKVLKELRASNQELLRKIIHIGMGPLIPLAKYLGLSQLSAQFFTGIIAILILINYINKLFPIIEDIDRKSYGTFFYCLSLFTLISIYWDKNPLALIAGCFVMTFGDGLAGLIGKIYKSKSWVVFNQKKSLIGTMTMFVASFLIMSLIGYFDKNNFTLSYLYLASLATLLEQISIVGIDNLTVPIISSVAFDIFV
tara:strand:- start:2486 stop:3076 length:591 start_codon:yes stop_codon:yes gene_type:complete